ncbi:MAG: hypothetical protein M3Y43_03350 [Pseudomonadota bacterium]|nr:hypothetical protein [Pseudomonadota bacterium]
MAKSPAQQTHFCRFGFNPAGETMAIRALTASDGAVHLAFMRIAFAPSHR